MGLSCLVCRAAAASAATALVRFDAVVNISSACIFLSSRASNTLDNRPAPLPLPCGLFFLFFYFFAVAWVAALRAAGYKLHLCCRCSRTVQYLSGIQGNPANRGWRGTLDPLDLSCMATNFAVTIHAVQTISGGPEGSAESQLQASWKPAGVSAAASASCYLDSQPG